jgi:transcription antitermination factor NusG
MSEWYVWTVIANRQKKINNFLSELDNIDEFLYPVAEKEYSTKKGRRVKDVPIYSNYIFIKYTHNNITESKIKACPWISEFVGKCSYEEIVRIKQQSNLKYDDLVKTADLKKGSRVKLVRTPFMGWEATVVDSMDGKLEVSISILGSERNIKCTIDDVELI